MPGLGHQLHSQSYGGPCAGIVVHEGQLSAAAWRRPGVHLEGGAADGLRERGVGVRGGERDQDLHGARVACGAHLVEQYGDGLLHGGLQVPYEKRGFAVVGGGGGVHPQPGGLFQGEHLVGVLEVDAVVLGEPQQGVRPQDRLVEDGSYVGLGGGADDAKRLEGQPTQQGVLAACGAEEFGDSAADGAGGEPGVVLVAGRIRSERSAAAEHVLGRLLDVPGGALRGDADLLHLDPDRPAAERGERGLPVAVGERANGGEGVQGPVEEGARGVSSVAAVSDRLGLRTVWNVVALGAQFGDPLF